MDNVFKTAAVEIKTRRKKSSARPAFEAECVTASIKLASALNQSPTLQKFGICVTARFISKKKVSTDEGTNWGTSYYERWGDIEFHLGPQGKPAIIALGSFGVLLVDGQPELECKNLLRGAPYSAVSFQKVEGFDELVEQIIDGTEIALRQTTTLAGKNVKNILGELRVIKTSLMAAQAKLVVMTEIIDTLQSAFPGLKPKQIIEGPLASHVWGPRPPWSHSDGYKVMDRTTFDASASVIATFVEQRTGETKVVLQTKPGKNLLYVGTGGGFQNPNFTEMSTYHTASSNGEQPQQAAARETCEEIRDDTGKPVLDLDPEKFCSIPKGQVNDYRAMAAGRAPVTHVLFHTWLEPQQIDAINTHAERMKTDAAYQKASLAHTNYESGGIEILLLHEAANLAPELFAHPQEYVALQTLDAILRPGRPLHSSQIVMPPSPAAT